VDKITKVLKKLSAKEREVVKHILEKLTSGNSTELDIKKLIGREDIYRIRKGNLRIIYQKVGGCISILAVERRNDRTYK